jgi:hypothetical protein
MREAGLLVVFLLDFLLLDFLLDFLLLDFLLDFRDRERDLLDFRDRERDLLDFLLDFRDRDLLDERRVRAVVRALRLAYADAERHTRTDLRTWRLSADRSAPLRSSLRERNLQHELRVDGMARTVETRARPEIKRGSFL